MRNWEPQNKKSEINIESLFPYSHILQWWRRGFVDQEIDLEITGYIDYLPRYLNMVPTIKKKL